MGNSLLKTTIVIEKTSIITFSVTLPEYHITTIDKWLSAQRSNNWHTPERLTSTHHIQQNHLATNFWAYVQEGTSHEEPIINAINVSFSRNLTYTTVSFFFFFHLALVALRTSINIAQRIYCELNQLVLHKLLQPLFHASLSVLISNSKEHQFLFIEHMYSKQLFIATENNGQAPL